MKKYLIYLTSGVLCLLGVILLFAGLFFDTQDIVKVRGQSIISNPQVIPGTGVIAGLPPLSSSCDELFFCKHPCTTAGSGVDCVDFCSPGQGLGATCTGSNNATGVCVGICSSTFQSTNNWISCNQQPTDALNCPAGDTCMGFAPQQTATGAICQDGCGPLHMTTGANGTVLTGSTPGLCTGSTSLVSGSLAQTAGGWIWTCGGTSGSSLCSMQILGAPSSPRGGKPSSIGSGSLPKKNIGVIDHTKPLPQKFTGRLRTALDRFASSCAYTDIDYRSLVFHDIQRNPEQDAIKTLQAYCIVKGYTISHHTQYHTEAATSVGEAIKILTKIVAMDEGVSFDEFGWYNGRLPYSDMLPNAWYTPYVIYADEYGYLDDITSWKMFGRSELKAYTPLTKKQFKQLLENFGKDTSPYDTYFMKSGKYVMRDDLAALVVDAFADDLVDYKYLYGNNTIFYRWLLARLEKKSNQKVYLQNLIAAMKKWDYDIMGWKYNLDVEGMVTFLEELVAE